jgi:tetratricopeptide (TPR) repeat protein
LASIELDLGLLEAISAKRAVLFTGAGASFGAKRDDGRTIPMAQALANSLSRQFLRSVYDNVDFKTVYDLSCSTRSVREVQDFIYTELSGYKPEPFHLLIPTFAWAGIITTNYDLILEGAYKLAPAPVQELLPNCKDGDGVPESVGSSGLLYVKLHGCITHYQEIDPPMIASTEQIIHHKKGRAGQFAQFLEWARTKTVIYIGYNLGDYNLRVLLDQIIAEGDAHPPHYIVRPGLQKEEADYWRDRRIRTVGATFEDFLRALDNMIPAPKRKLSLIPAAETFSSFTRFISRPNITETASLIRYFESQCEHVSEQSPVPAVDPHRFYRGSDLGWYPFKAALDVPRRIGQAIFEERIVPQGGVALQFVVIKGHAGSGKSVLLRRLAWDAATRLSRLVLRVHGGGALDVNMFDEIFSLINQPIYLFVDDVADDVAQIANFLRYASRRKWPLVVIGGARIHEWNVRCEDLEPLLDEEYVLKYLSDHEIEVLLSKLTQSNALGRLQGITLDEQKRKLKEIYGRQLLVALYEATENASFRDIIADEYEGINPVEAKILYLDICSLHRFGSPVRAGLISRVHGIDFDDFRDRFFKPLEQVVDFGKDPKTQDWTYKARHAVIADLVYSSGLPSVAEKYDNLMRIIKKLNPSYSYDQEVLFQLIRANTLAELFPDRVMGESVYAAAVSAFGEIGVIMHQHGIYEMRRAGDYGNLNRAETLLERALELTPGSSSIKHSLAELALKRSTLAASSDEREIWRRRSESQAHSLAKASKSSHPQNTLAKAAIARVRDALERTEENDNELSQEVLGNAINTAEDVIRDGLKRFANDDRLLNEEANLGEILQNADRTLKALRLANKSNPRSELIARRLSRILRSKSLFEEAISILQGTLELNPGSQTLHYELARTLMEISPAADVLNGETILYHLKRSFSRGDKNTQARFWYARQLCLVGKGSDAYPIFAEMYNSPMSYSQKRAIQGTVYSSDGSEAIYYGQLYVKKPTFGFVRADQDNLEAFLASDNYGAWETVTQGQRLSYNLGFNLRGPVALDAKSR